MLSHQAILSLGLMAALDLRAVAAPLCVSQQLRMPGDYVLGGLFPIGSAEGANVGNQTQPRGPVCDRSSPLGLLWALAVKMAVEEINRGRSLLPGLRLGYDLYDTCSELVVAMRPSLSFLAEVGSCTVATYCSYVRYQPRVLAVIGPYSSELALVTGKFFGFFLMPQVSYGASTDRLSSREAFPSFFRTVPSDRMQAAAAVELLAAFGWNWVAAVGSDNEYGRQGLGIFSSLAARRGICVAHEGLVPLPRAAGPLPDRVEAILRRVHQSGAQVLLLFASAQAARALFSHSLRALLAPKVWVASEAWLDSGLVTALPGMDRVGTVLGFRLRGVPLPDFPAYVETRLALAADPAFCAALGAEAPGLEEQRCPPCDRITPTDVSGGLRHHQTFAAYAAVYGVAQALHNALGCNASGCPGRAPLRPWQLLPQIYNLSFRARGLALTFDASGNVNLGYDLKLWVWRGRALELRTVGAFRGRLQLNRSQIVWHTQGNRQPVSQCFRQCQEGQVRRVKGFHSCCYDCVDCKAGTYQRSQEDFLCTKCGRNQWSPDRSRRCFPRTPKFLAWGEPEALGLLLLLILLLGLLLAALGLFLRHRHSPLVRASGGLLACLGLACLGLACLSVLLFLGQPSPASCLAQQPLFHLPLTGCLSTLLLQSTTLFAESELPLGWAGWLRGWLGGPRAWLLVLLAVLAEAVLCTCYLVALPPAVVTDWQVLPTQALVHCRVHSWAGLGLMHGANATLAGLCFLGTFLVQGRPGCYNGARGLTFAMVAYFGTWVSFVPLYANVHVANQPAVQAGTFLLCALGIMATFYLPKCYLLLCRPELNTPEFFLGEGPRGASGREEAQEKNE
ncbi:taste receptor type 1 member 3 [Tamandua tetradactyla]|uniref:taste receptor type 1 member 3 n=1 Tax=Tamandua tetradactyla TaxID=48850 RepID=UPI004053D8C5